MACLTNECMAALNLEQKMRRRYQRPKKTGTFLRPGGGTRVGLGALRITESFPLRNRGFGQPRGHRTR